MAADEVPGENEVRSNHQPDELPSPRVVSAGRPPPRPLRPQHLGPVRAEAAAETAGLGWRAAERTPRPESTCPHRPDGLRSRFRLARGLFGYSAGRRTAQDPGSRVGEGYGVEGKPGCAVGSAAVAKCATGCLVSSSSWRPRITRPRSLPPRRPGHRRSGPRCGAFRGRPRGRLEPLLVGSASLSVVIQRGRRLANPFGPREHPRPRHLA